MNPALEFFLWVVAGAAAAWVVWGSLWLTWQVIKLAGMVVVGFLHLCIESYWKHNPPKVKS